MTKKEIEALKRGERIEGKWDDYYFFDNDRNEVGHHYCIDRENWIYDDEYFSEEEILNL